MAVRSVLPHFPRPSLGCRLSILGTGLLTLWSAMMLHLGAAASAFRYEGLAEGALVLLAAALVEALLVWLTWRGPVKVALREVREGSKKPCPKSRNGDHVFGKWGGVPGPWTCDFCGMEADTPFGHNGYSWSDGA